MQGWLWNMKYCETFLRAFRLRSLRILRPFSFQSCSRNCKWNEINALAAQKLVKCTIFDFPNIQKNKWTFMPLYCNTDTSCAAWNPAEIIHSRSWKFNLCLLIYFTLVKFTPLLFLDDLTPMVAAIFVIHYILITGCQPPFNSANKTSRSSS